MGWLLNTTAYPYGPGGSKVAADDIYNPSISSGKNAAFYNRGASPVTAPTGNNALPQIEQLTQMVNEINQRAQQAANKGRIPGGGALEDQSSANIASALRGEIDPDTLYLLGQQAAERGVMSGSPLGPSTNADYLRAVYDTSANRMNTGQNWLTGALARNPAAPIYDAGNQVLTAGQLLQAELAREEMANRLRIAQMQSSRAGGSPIARSGSNWQPQPEFKPVFGPDRRLPTPTPWTPTPDPSFSNSFLNSGGTWQPTFGDNPVLSFETDWNDLLFGGNNPGNAPSFDQADQDWQEIEDWFFAPGG